jgi:hypothetical protein
MIRVFFFFLSCCVLFSSCYCEECCACEGASGEIDLSVLDMDNKPITNVTVGPYIYPNGNNTYSFFKQTYQTDAKGQIHFNYVFPIDSYTDWTLAVGDFNDYKPVNFIKSPYSYTPSHKKITVIDTIRMDVLKPITLRFKSNRTDIKSLNINVFRSNYPVSTNISRDFYFKTINRSSGVLLDTTIQVNAYSKAEFTISSRMNFSNAPLDVSKSKVINNYVRRDTVFVFEF